MRNGFQIKGPVHRPSPILLQTARSLQADESSGERPWEQYIDFGLSILAPEFQRPRPETDIFSEANWVKPKRFFNNVVGTVQQWFGRTPSFRPIHHPTDSLRTRNPDRPRIFHGLIASASRVLKDSRTRERLRIEHGAKAVEMETAGAAHAAYTANLGYFVVRGACDYCNHDKNDIWQCYAALVAAAYTRALLEATDIRVFASTKKILAIVEPIAPTLERHDDAGTPSRADLQRAVRDAEKTVTPTGEPPTNLERLISRTSEAIREIPRVSLQPSSVTSQPPVAGIRSSLPSETIVTDTGDLANTVAETERSSGLSQVEQINESQGSQVSERERQFLIAEGEKRLAELKDLLEIWEFDAAFAVAPVTEDWIARNESHLTPALVSEIYGMLARIETTKAQQNRESGEKPDFSKARDYLSKARKYV